MYKEKETVFAYYEGKWQKGIVLGCEIEDLSYAVRLESGERISVYHFEMLPEDTEEFPEMM